MTSKDHLRKLPAGETASDPACSWCFKRLRDCKCMETGSGNFTVPEPVPPGGAADLTEAFRIAVEVHGNQRDKSGAEPYMGHVCRVASGMETDIGRVVAILHDVLEDAETTGHDLERRIHEAYGESVLAAVKVLTRHPDTPYLDYIRHVAHNPLAVTVKLADLSDNMREDRLAKLPLTDSIRLRQKYTTAFAQLKPAAPIAPAAQDALAGYLKKAEEFLVQSAKLDNAPLAYMIAAAFRNEDRIRAVAELAPGKITKEDVDFIKSICFQGRPDMTERQERRMHRIIDELRLIALAAERKEGWRK
jgi:hypothetical protein